MTKALPDVDELDAVHARMRAAADRGGQAAGLYQWIRYHLGWADNQGHPVEARRGKGVRPRLCLLACRAVGGHPDRAIAAASALELTHEFSLIHDDIQDRDRTRRGRPAVWTFVGEAHAINIGDAVFSLARAELTASPVAPHALVGLLERYDRACLALAEGQYLDLLFEQRDDVSAEEYVGMIQRKTGALLGASAALGAEVADAGPTVGDAFEKFGLAVGVAFQIADDLLGVWGDEALTGKPAGNDLLRGKKSYPVLLARQRDPSLAAELDDLMSGEARIAGAETMARRMHDAGLREHTALAAKAAAQSAIEALEDLALDPSARAELEAFAVAAADRAS